MLKITIIELLFRAVPEAFLFMWTSYMIARISIDKKKYFISSIFCAISIYLIRLLPINIGVNIIITSAVYIIVTAAINKIPTMKAISGIMISSILLSICESLNVLVLEKLGVNMEKIVNEPLTKIIYFAPSLILFGGTIWLLYILKYKKKEDDGKSVFS